MGYVPLVEKRAVGNRGHGTAVENNSVFQREKVVLVLPTFRHPVGMST